MVKTANAETTSSCPEIVEPVDGDGDRLGAAGVEQDGGAELAERRDEDQQEGDEQPGAGQRDQDAPDGREPAGAGDAGGLLQRRIDLAEGGVGAARRQRNEARDVGDEQDPNGAVDGERRADERQQDADGHHRARQAQRQDGEIVEETAPPQLRAHVEIGDGCAERYGDQGGSGGEPEAVEDAAHGDLVGEEGGVEVRQREVGERRWIDPALAEGGERQHADRRNGAEEDDRATEGQQRPSPAAELGASGAHAAPADRDVGAPLQIAALDRKPDHGQQHEHERQRRRLAPARGIAADGAVDAGRQEHDPRRRAEDRLRPEQGERVDGREQRSAGDGRGHERQIDAPDHGPAAGAQHLRQLLERGIDRLQRAVGEEIGEGEDVDADDEDHAAHAEDVEGRRLEPETASAARG